MSMISKIMVVVGLLATVVGNVMSYLGIRASINAIMAGESSGIAELARGLNSALTFSLVSLVGCLILIVGVVLAASSISAMRRPLP